MSMRLLTLLCGVLLLSPLAVAADSGGSSDNPWARQPTQQDSQADYDDGYRQLKAGNYQDAIAAFKKVVRADADNAMAYTNMAYSYRKLGRYSKSIKLYEKALAINPDLPEAHEYLGEALLALGRLEEAKRHLAILERLDTKLAEDLRASIARHEQS